MLTIILFGIFMIGIFSLPVLAFTGVLESMATGKPVRKNRK